MITYCIVAFLNVFFHVVKTLMIVKASKLVASTANCFCYTFSAVVVKFIAESDLMVAILIAAFTNFAGCYAGMYVFEKFKKQITKHQPTMRRNFFTRLYDLLIGDPTEYKKRHTYRVKFNKFWQFRDKDTNDRQLQTFFVHGWPVSAYSRKDAIKRWTHADLKNRRKRSRR